GDRDGGALLRELRRLGLDGREDPARLLEEVTVIRAGGRAAGSPGVPAHDVDASLLTQVWGCGHGPRAALRTLRVMGAGVRAAPDVAGWVCAPLLAAPPVGAEPAWHALAEEVAGHALRAALPAEAERVLDDRAALEAALTDWSRAVESGPAAVPGPPWALLARAHPTPADVSLRAVAALLLDRWEPPTAARVLRDCPAEVFVAYREAAAHRLCDDPPDADAAARVYLAAVRSGLGPERAAVVEREVLVPALAGWGRRNTARVRRHLPHGEAAGFDLWVRGHRSRRGLFGARGGDRG
ncbi:GTPase-associated protein 1-related protein, partial [Nocardiopsis sp. CC223A]|uniref:GTPase-associated protein 1-related protein n=1 Tax=Nocardiopsis sp. CC223A TaxID=3044051 RepID=UPI002795772D